MSGVKDTIVNLRRSEYNRMMNSCRRMDNIDSTVRSNMDRMAGNLRRDLDNRISQVNRRHDNLERGLSSLSGEMQRVQKEQNHRIREQAREFQRGLDSLGQEMTSQRREYTRMIHEQEQRFNQSLQQQRRELEGQIQSIQDALVRKEASEREQAQQWINDARIFLETIGREYRHEKFKPGALEKIQSELAMSQGNFNNGNYQAAIASAQQTFLRASELRLELEQMEMEWEAHLEGARNKAAEALATLEAQETSRFTFDTTEGSEEVAGEVDFWTDGALTDLRKKVEAERKHLGAPEDMSLEDLKQSIASSEQWRQESLELSERAKEAIIASQLRNNLGQSIEDALADAGWEITDATYEGEDFRGAVHVKLRNLPGDEVVTIIQPEAVGDGTITNRISISFFDRSTNDETFRLQRLTAITEIFQKEGMDVAPPVCRPGTENQPSQDVQKLDFEQVRQKQRVQTT